MQTGLDTIYCIIFQVLVGQYFLLKSKIRLHCLDETKAAIEKRKPENYSPMNHRRPTTGNLR
jgi:hypothetical protein